MSNSPIGRRGFLHALAAGAATIAVPFPSRAGPRQFRVRKNFNTLRAGDPEFDGLIKGVGALKEQSATKQIDVTGWDGQAQLHVDHCPHRNWFFLPWHRAYLFFFEEICRRASGVEKFTLPYWDWGKDRKVPAPFLDSGSPLYDPERDANIAKWEANAKRVGREVEDRVAVQTDFEALGGVKAKNLRDESGAGLIEREPHDYIHKAVGGVTKQNTPGHLFSMKAALDPLFWLHHAHVDRLWARWTQDPKPAGKKWPSEDYWRNQKLEFYDTQGNPAFKTVEQCLSTFKLGYTYDDLVPITDELPELKEFAKGTIHAVPFSSPDVTKWSSARIGLTTDGPKYPLHSSTSLLIDRELRGRVTAHFQGAEVRPRIETVRLRVTFGGDLTSPDLAARVYLNNPQANPETPTSDPSFVGYVSFFNPPDHYGMHDRARESAYCFGLDEVLRREPMRTWLEKNEWLVSVVAESEKGMRTPLELRKAWVEMVELKESPPG
jgi:tyrosinase